MKCLFVLIAILLAGCGNSDPPFLLQGTPTPGCVELVRDSITYLLGSGYVDGVNWVNRGVPGVSSGFIGKELGLIKGDQPSAVFLEIGTNDLQGGDRDGLEGRIAWWTLALSPLKVYVVSLLPTDPQYAYNSKRHNSEIVVINENLHRMFGDAYVDVWSAFVQDGIMNPELSDDGLHPNTKGQAVMLSIYRESLKK